MTVRKKLSTLAVATLTTGTVMVEGLAGVYEAAEHIIGYPVFTHELPDAADRIKERVVAQIPAFPTEIGEDGWEATRDFLLAHYGPEIELERGTDERTEGPITSLVRKMGRG